MYSFQASSQPIRLTLLVVFKTSHKFIKQSKGLEIPEKEEE
jgi:hypothetical protein